MPKSPQRIVPERAAGVVRAEVDRTATAIGLTILKTPERAPPANAFCERLIGTIRRECLDWIIPSSEDHLRSILRGWVAHYNRGVRTRASGPAFPTALTRRRYRGIGSCEITAWPRKRFWVRYITSTVSSELREPIGGLVADYCGVHAAKSDMAW